MRANDLVSSGAPPPRPSRARALPGMAEYVTEEMAGEIREAFALHAKPGSVLIKTSEIATVLRTLALAPGEQMLADVIAKADPQGSGTVEVDDLITLVGRIVRDSGAVEIARMAFRVFDKDGIGTMTPSELRYVLTNLPGDKVALTDEEFDELLADSVQAAGATNLEKPALPNPDDGLMHYEVFTEYMRKFNKDK